MKTYFRILVAMVVISMPPVQAAEPGSNVLFIAVDDLRTSLGCYGDALVKSPNIDRFAATARRFDHAYTQQAVCGPSRTSLLTGRLPDNTRVWHNRNLFRDTEPDLVTLPQLFKSHGYHTVSLGKIFSGNERELDPDSWTEPEILKQKGWRNSALGGSDGEGKGAAWEAADVPDEGYTDGKLASIAVEKLTNLKSAGQPFFLAVGFFKPHLPFNAPKRYWDLYDPGTFDLDDDGQRVKGISEHAHHSHRELGGYREIPKDEHLDAETTRKLRHGYHACVSYTDAQIGKLLARSAAKRPAVSQSAAPVSSDVVIYGATPAGIAAALAAAAGQHSVLLIEPTSRIGGMMTHGLSHSDFHSFEALHGPFLQFSQRVLKHYESSYGKDSEQVRDCWRGTHGEPSANLLVFGQMLAEKPAIRILTQHRLARVTVEDQSITALTLSRPDGDSVTITPRLVIDASYEGDLLAAAGVPYRVGREARSEYGESLAPETADDQVQGYNFRLCMTQDPKNRVPLPVPANYDREDYAALVPLVKADKFRSAFGYPGSPFVLKAHLPALPNGKRDINDVSKGLVRLSLPGRNHDYPEGDLATRQRIEREHLDWQLGLIHFMQTDSALPEAFRKEAATWGLCRDEFADTNHIPPQIYVREARRMVGLHVYTEADTEYAPNDARSRLHSNSIAVGEYSHNCHGTDHEGPMIGGRHTGEFYKGVAPYQIPYGVIVPTTMHNLLVPTACSASHVGFCAIRLEPIWMSLGGAAGHAADMAFEENVPVQQVDVEALQKRIWSHGGATIHVSDVPPGHPDFTAVQWWAGLGGLHGLEPAPAKPGARGKQIVSQYFEAFPGHAARLNLPLDDELRKRWTALAKEHRLLVPAESTTRGDWIREVFTASANLSGGSE